MSNQRIFDRSTIIRIILGTAIGGLAVYFAFRKVSVSQLGAVIAQANPWLLVVGLLVVLLNVATVSLRWWVMLLRNWRFSEYLALMGGVYLGQMFNILLPARLGELARIYFVSERVQTTKSGLLGSLVLEKVIDFFTYGVALLLLITAISLPAWITESGKTLIILALIALISVFVLVLWGRNFIVRITPLLKRLPEGWSERITGILERALTGFDSMREWRRQLPIWLLTIFSLFLATLTNYITLRAIHIQLPFTAALLILIVLRVGSAPPSAPGKLGVFQYLAILALAAYSIEKDLALAYGVLLYVVALVSKILIGVGIILFSRWRLPDLKLHMDNSKEVVS